MAQTPTVYQRRRSLTEQELKLIPWFGLLKENERNRIESQLVVSDPMPGDYVCRMGRQAT